MNFLLRAPMARHLWPCSLLLLVPLCSACVKRSTHRIALADLAQARAVQDTLRDDLRRQGEVEDSLRGVMADLRLEIAGLEERQRELEVHLEEAADEVHRLEVMLTQRGSFSIWIFL